MTSKQDYLFVAIIIELNKVTKLPKVVPAWHLPVYLEKFGEMVEVGEYQTKSVDEIVATEELDRMRGYFGVDPDTKQSYFDVVYGRGPRALDALEDAMAQKAARARKAKKKVNEDDKELLEILAGTVPEITEALADLTAEQLVRLGELEAKGKARTGVAEAIAEYDTSEVEETEKGADADSSGASDDGGDPLKA